MVIQGPDVSENFAGVVAIVCVFVIFPIALAYARVIWKRGAAPPARPLSEETAQRLVQMQQSIDAMAIELERISEGQRFVTKLMSEKAPAALPQGAPSSKSSRAAD